MSFRLSFSSLAPRGYWARSTLILLLPMALLIIAMTAYFFSSHVAEVNTRLSRTVAQEIALLRHEVDSGDADFERIRQAYANLGIMRVTLARGAPLPAPGVGDQSCCVQLDEALTALVGEHAIWRDPASGLVRVHVPAQAGILTAEFERKRAEMITAHFFIVWTILFSILMLLMSYAFLKNHVRSIILLTNAADAFGRGEDIPDFKPSGAREVRAAALSLMRMRNRIRRYADQRTAMLAGVSHDLRTPLTRLKLELALLPKTIEMGAAKADIAEMEKMLDAYLAFARGEEGEQPETVDLCELAREASSAAASRAQLQLVAAAPLMVRLRPLALKRAIANLANNAADHAKNVRITVARDGGTATVIVEDDGPGIPPEQFEDAFRPFSRLDKSRNQNVAGVGLGLTIARDAARAHGGDVALGRSALGGLRAILRLPTAPDQQVRKDRD